MYILQGLPFVWNKVSFLSLFHEGNKIIKARCEIGWYFEIYQKSDSDIATHKDKNQNTQGSHPIGLLVGVQSKPVPPGDT